MFVELILKDCILVLKNEEENFFLVLTCSIKRETRNFHVVVV